jgi:hypothetical protein
LVIVDLIESIQNFRCRDINHATEGNDENCGDRVTNQRAIPKFEMKERGQHGSVFGSSNKNKSAIWPLAFPVFPEGIHKIVKLS